MRAVIVCRRYIPGQAWTNRMFCYVKGLCEQGFHVDLVFIIANKDRSFYSIPITGVSVYNIWEKDCWLARKSRLFAYIININRLSSYVNGADYCIMFDGGGLFVNKLNRLRGKTKVVVEITEHPEIIYYPFFRDFMLKRQLKMIKSADTVLVISNSIKEYLIEKKVEEGKIKTVNIFVDIERFNCVEKQIDSNTIAYCGTLGCQKDGIDILIKAFSIFLESHPDYKLFLYGKGESEKTIPSFKEFANRLGISDNIVFKGYTPYEDMPQELMNAKILVLSRPHNKQNDNGFPTKLGEYLSTANPVVVTSVGEIPLFIKDGINGYLAQPGDVESFAEKMSFVADNYIEACRVGKNGKMLALNEFSYYNQIARIFKK